MIKITLSQPNSTHNVVVVVATVGKIGGGKSNRTFTALRCIWKKSGIKISKKCGSKWMALF